MNSELSQLTLEPEIKAKRCKVSSELSEQIAEGAPVPGRQQPCTAELSSCPLSGFVLKQQSFGSVPQSAGHGEE